MLCIYVHTYIHVYNCMQFMFTQLHTCTYDYHDHYFYYFQQKRVLPLSCQIQVQEMMIPYPTLIHMT